MVVDYVKLLGYGNYIIQIYNEGAGRVRRGAHAAKTGLRVGASDLFFAMPAHGYHGFFLELKSKNGKLSHVQKEFLSDMKTAGYYTYVAFSFDEASCKLKWYLKKANVSCL